MFLGAATSAFQIEGGLATWGRTPSIWDAACPDAEQACDSLRRWPEDLECLRRARLRAYRFSLSWPRLQPGGEGPLSSRAADYYDRMVDDLLAAGITPWVTLYHWDQPSGLPGWQSEETVHALADFSHRVGRLLGDRVKNWFTLNEPWCVAELGYRQGEHAPFLRLNDDEVSRVRQHLLLAHRLSWQELHRYGRAGPAMVPIPFLPYRAGDEEACELAWREVNDPWFVRLEGDFWGLNLYYPSYVEAAADSWREVEFQGPRNALGWPLDSAFIRPTVERILSRYDAPALVVSETGVASHDDSQRLDYLKDYLTEMRALPLEGVFIWSLLDNVEWQHGFTAPFGLFDRERRPRPSAEWVASFHGWLGRAEGQLV